MRYWLALAALGAVLALPAYAQRGGGGHGSGFGGHGGAGFSGHASMGGGRPSSGYHGGGFSQPGNGGHSGYGRPGFGYGHGHPGYGYGRGYRPWGWGWGWGGYPWWGWGYGYPGWGWGYGWDDNSYYDNSYYAQPSYAQPSAYYNSQPDYYAQNNQIVQEQQALIDRLNDELANSREHEEDMRKARPSSSSASSQPTELVFRDKHTENVQNYAIVGQTLWILSPDRARKIPLSDLDLSGTKKANEDRGVEFDLPK
jgi:hypothetical protein